MQVPGTVYKLVISILVLCYWFRVFLSHQNPAATAPPTIITVVYLYLTVFQNRSQIKRARVFCIPVL